MKVAIVELSSSHDECIYSQVQFLKQGGHEVVLFCSHKVHERLTYQNELDDVVITKNKLSFFDYFLLWRKLSSYNLDKIVFNTCQGGLVKKLLFFPFSKKIELLGVLHDISKLEGSYGQKMISKKVNKYFLLNDYLLDNVKKMEVDSHSKFSTFYPIFFPKQTIKSLAKKEDEVWVCVPGQVEFKRRDYQSLLTTQTTLNKNIRLIFLGQSKHFHGDGEEIEQELKAMGCAAQVTMFDGFVDLDDFFAYIKQADYILPLIHQGHVSYDLYQKQITGAFNLAFGFQKKFLLEDTYSEYSDFQENTVFYKKENLLATINDLTPVSDEYVYQNSKWKLESQAGGYLEFMNK